MQNKSYFEIRYLVLFWSFSFRERLREFGTILPLDVTVTGYKKGRLNFSFKTACIGIIYLVRVYYSAVFLLIALLVVDAGASSTLCAISTPANSGSIMIRPQYSQTITFLRERISSCLWGGILLKQPPHASRCTYTIPKPLREFLRIRLNDCNRRGSIFVSRSFALSLSFSSSCFVSANMIFWQKKSNSRLWKSSYAKRESKNFLPKKRKSLQK